MTSETHPIDPSNPSAADVLSASRALAGRVLRTPLLSVPAINQRAQREILIKPESLQHIGAFKARGALYACSKLSAQALAAGLCTFSSGNHGQAVALAAREAKTLAVVVMPEDAPQTKVEAVRELGAEVVFAGKTTADRQTRAETIARERGLTIIPPFDDAHVIAGQGTATLELIEDAAARGTPVDAVIVPVGGGGLLAGACLAAELAPSAVKVIAAEPETADAFRKSLLAGRRVTIPPSSSIADGLRPIQVGALNFAVAEHRVAQAITVSDAEIGLATVRLLAWAKLFVEPSGACALAACFSSELPKEIRRIGVLVSGGNMAMSTLQRLLAEHGESFAR
jgi:threonine dehydratase